jgi:outer membrane protein TolC
MRNLLWAGLLLIFHSSAAPGQGAARLSLQDAVRKAVENHPGMLKGRQAVEAARARVLQEGRIPNPEIGVTWGEIPPGFDPGKAAERDFTFTQPLEFPTKRSGRVNVAEADAGIAELQLRREQLLVSARVKRAYYDRLLSDAVVAGLREQITLLTDFRDLLIGRYRSGANSYLDVVRTKVEITRLKNDLVEASRQNRAGSAQLNLLLGMDPQTVVTLTDTLAAGPMPGGADSLVSALLDGSSLLQVNQNTVARQEANLSLARSGYLPDLALGIAHQSRGDERNLWGLELAVSVPLWFWQEPKGKVEEADAALAIARMQEAASRQRVRGNILSALDLAASAYSRLKVFEESLLTDSQDILTTSITSYRNNQLDVLNVLDVYRTYRATRLEYLRALHRYAVALAELEVSAEIELANKPGDME